MPKREGVVVYRSDSVPFSSVNSSFRFIQVSKIAMADEISENGHANGSDVPEIELIIKVSVSLPRWPFVGRARD